MSSGQRQEKDTPLWWRILADASNMIIALAAIATFALTTYFSIQSQRANELAHTTAQDALKAAQDAQKYVQTTAERELASKVYIGATPMDLSDKPEISDVAVVNVSPVDMYEVVLEGVAYWTVTGDKPSIVPPAVSHGPEMFSIRTFQACTGYAVPANFELEKIYFFDGSVHWIRHRDGRLEKSNEPGPTAEGLEIGAIFGDKGYKPPEPRETYVFDTLSCS